MLIESFDLKIEISTHSTERFDYEATAHLNVDIGPALPYLNATLSRGIYLPDKPALSWRYQGHNVGFWAYRIATDEDEAASIRCAALESLAFEDSPSVTRLIMKFYNGGRKDFRCAALISMGRSGAERWVNVLMKSVLSKDDEIARAAIEACGEAGYH